MQKKIIIISSGHPSMDERIYWKFGLSLSGNGYKVQITTSCEELYFVKENVTILSFNGNNISKKEKINRFFLMLKDFSPDLIICCEPLPILAASKFRKLNKNCKIISDITEWYPYQSHYVGYSGIKRLLNYIRHFVFNVYATNLADHLIIGEQLKARLYKYISPFKGKTIIGYYPPKKYFNYYPVKLKANEINLCFSGIFTSDRGFDRILELIKLLSIRLLNIKINLILVGKFITESDKLKLKPFEMSNNVSIIIKEWTTYNLYGSQFADADICIDLRSKTKVLNRSLPIKIFDYMALGKPVIYSNVDALYHFPDIKQFGHLVDPDDFESAIKIIENYLKHPEELEQHSANARKLFEEKYSWELFEVKFLDIIGYLIQV